MIRVIIRSVNHAGAVNVGGPIEIEHKTIDIDAPEVEEFLSEPRRMNDHCTSREIIACEVFPLPPAEAVASKERSSSLQLCLTHVPRWKSEHHD